MRRIQSHLTYANVMATIAVFIAISGGTAVALSGSNTVQSDDLGPGAQVNAPDVAANAVNSAKVVNESLTGAEIKNRSGVDTCVATIRIGDLCYRAENSHRPWREALSHCANLGLRLPSLGEGLELARTHDLQNVDQNEFFWSDQYYFYQGQNAFKVSDLGDREYGDDITSSNETVCVGTPTN